MSWILKAGWSLGQSKLSTNTYSFNRITKESYYADHMRPPPCQLPPTSPIQASPHSPYPPSPLLEDEEGAVLVPPTTLFTVDTRYIISRWKRTKSLTPPSHVGLPFARHICWWWSEDIWHFLSQFLGMKKSKTCDATQYWMQMEVTDLQKRIHILDGEGRRGEARRGELLDLTCCRKRKKKSTKKKNQSNKWKCFFATWTTNVTMQTNS